MDHHARRPEQVLWFRHALAAFTALALVEAGQAAEARDMLGAVCAAIDHGAPWDYAQNCAICVAGEAAARLSDTGVAAELLPSCLSLIEQDVGDYYMTSAELTAARLLGVLGEHEDALRHIGAARERAAAQGQRPLGAIIDYEEADMTPTRGGNNGPDPLLAVVARFEQLGMHEWVQRAMPARTPSPVLPDGLTPREAHILGWVAAGKTNREIAAELIISVHTVERHIHNAYQKIEVRNRADATAYVIRHGLGQALSP
jgi:DNA-binding CsgD family transcriptional regulator